MSDQRRPDGQATGLVMPRKAPTRPDSRPMRILFGLTGIAATSAIATAIVMPTPSGPSATVAVVQTPIVRDAAIKHITRYVQLKPGQTAPPSALVRAAPDPTPRIVVITTTRQSGKP